MGFVLFIVMLIVGIALFIAFCTRSREADDSWCPHGYEDFGCQPSCPLYENCWERKED